MITLAIVLAFLALQPGSGALPPLVDPTTDPAGFLTNLVALAHTHLFLTIAVGLYGLLELLAWFGKTNALPKLEALGKGRLSLVIAGGVAVLGSGLHAFFGSGSLEAAVVASMLALAAYWHPAAADVAKSQAPEK